VDGGVRRVQTAAYEAVVDEDGCFTNLRIGGAEFFKSVPRGFPRGGYPYQDGILKLPGVEQPEPNVITAKSDKASVRYEFGPDAITWKFTNLTAKPLLFVVVFDLGVNAVMGEAGRFAKPPVTKAWPTTTWFRDKANVRISGGTRVWGPWSGNHQVWQVDIAPGQTGVVQLKAGAATDMEIAKAVQTATAPPPPPPADPVGPMWDLKKLSNPPKTYPADEFKGDGVRAVFYDGPPYEGRPTRVFAWIGLPKLEPGQKAPGMVLVHGGGGTTFDTWVRRWTAAGYAAISMDTCGCVPRGTYGKWARHEFGGPPGWGGYGQIDDPREDQWTYHAVAAAILGHSLLRSVPEVDAERIGLTGISWGGYLTCIIAGADPRFKFAVPVYGCGFTTEHGFAGSVNGLGKERGDRWMRWWDPSAYLRDAAMPMLWVTGSNDFAYTLNAVQKSYRLPKGPRTLCIRLRMPHGHGDAGEGPKEIYAFADSVLKGGDPLVKITGQGRDGNQVWATYESKRPIVKAELNTTRDAGKWQDRKWEATPAQLSAPGKATVTLPEGVAVYYLNLFDDRNLAVSTEHEELALPQEAGKAEKK